MGWYEAGEAKGGREIAGLVSGGRVGMQRPLDEIAAVRRTTLGR